MQRASRSLLYAGIAIAVAGSALALHPAVTTDFESWRSLKLAFVVLGAALAGAGMLAGMRPSAARLRWVDVAIGFYLAWLSLGFVVGPRQALRGLDELALQSCAALLFVAASRLVATDARAPGRLFGLVAATACVVSAFALAEAVGIRLPWDALRRPYSTLGGRNFVGAYAGMAIPLVLGALLRGVRSRRRAAGLGAALSLLTTVLLLTRCRSAWLGLGLGLAVWLVSLAHAVRRARARGGRMGIAPPKRSLRLAVSALVVALAAASAVPWPGLRWTDAHPLASTASRIVELDSGSGRVRIEQGLVGVAIVRQHPLLGAGPRQWDEASREDAHAASGNHAQRWSASPSPQSDLVRIAAEHGLPAALALIAACALLVIGAASRGVALAAVASLCVGIVHGMLDVPLFRPEAVALLAVVAGVLRRTTPATAIRLPRAAGAALVVAAVGAGLVAGVLGLLSTVTLARGAADDVGVLERSQALYYRQDIEERIAMTLVARAQCGQAEEHISRALSASPSSWGLLELAGSCAEARGDLAAANAAYLKAATIEPHDAGLAAAVARTTSRSR